MPSRAYYRPVRADRLIELQEQLLAAARERLAATERMLRVVAADQVDVLGAQVEVATQEQAVQTARGELRKPQLALGEVMGVEEFAAFELVDPLREYRTLPALTHVWWIARPWQL